MGCFEGGRLGFEEGDKLGCSVVGLDDGSLDGLRVGFGDGESVGEDEVVGEYVYVPVSVTSFA